MVLAGKGTSIAGAEATCASASRARCSATDCSDPASDSTGPGTTPPCDSRLTCERRAATSASSACTREAKVIAGGTRLASVDGCESGEGLERELRNAPHKSGATTAPITAPGSPPIRPPSIPPISTNTNAIRSPASLPAIMGDGHRRVAPSMLEGEVGIALVRGWWRNARPSPFVARVQPGDVPLRRGPSRVSPFQLPTTFLLVAYPRNGRGVL